MNLAWAIALTTLAAAILPTGGSEPPLALSPTKTEPPALSDAVEAFKEASGKIRNEELNCLAALAYFEARGESLEGQLAVAHVAINRIRARLWPGGACEVARQPRQFAEIDREPHDIEAWRTAKAIAWLALNGYPDPTGGATHFHSGKSPTWAGKLEAVGTIENHRFYKETR